MERFTRETTMMFGNTVRLSASITQCECNRVHDDGSSGVSISRENAYVRALATAATDGDMDNTTNKSPPSRRRRCPVSAVNDVLVHLRRCAVDREIAEITDELRHIACLQRATSLSLPLTTAAAAAAASLIDSDSTSQRNAFFSLHV